MRVDLTANGQYDYTQPWYNNANDRVMWERAFQQNSQEAQLQVQALFLADPLTPNKVIRGTLTANPVVPQFGVDKHSPTLDDVLDGNYSSGNLYDSAPTDFSGTQAGMDATSRPSVPYWS